MAGVVYDKKVYEGYFLYCVYFYGAASAHHQEFLAAGLAIFSLAWMVRTCFNELSSLLL